MDKNTAQPWIGPDYYTEKLQDVFFGRTAETDELVRLVDRELLTVLFGASGLGKTSLLLAGLFPRLRAAGSLPVHVRLDHSDDAPPLGEQVLLAIREAATSAGFESPEAHPRESLWEHFHREGNLYWTRDHHVVTPVVVLDQFEEIFTRGRQTETRTARTRVFVAELADLIESHQPLPVRARLERERKDAIEAGYRLERLPLKIVLSLREDYLAPLEQLRDILPSLLRNRMRLTALTVAQATEVVEKPAAPFHLLEPGLAGAIIRYVSATEPGATQSDLAPPSSEPGPALPSAGGPEGVDPALLSIFCFELNTRRIEMERDRITLNLLEGSKEEILVGFYDRAFEGLPLEVRKFVEEELVSPGGFRDSRAIDDAVTFPGVTLEHLDLLVKRRLLQYEDRGTGPRRVELKHDVFLRVAEKSRAERTSAERRKLRNRKLMRRIVSLFTAGAISCALVGGALYWYGFVKPYTAYFADITKRRGEPCGVGELSARQIAARIASFRIVRHGRFGHVDRVEAVDDRLRPTTLHELSTYFSYAFQRNDSKRRGEVGWKFGYDDDGQLLYEIAYDREQKPVWSFIYAPGSQRDPKDGTMVRVGRFLGERGLPLAHFGGFFELRFDEKSGFESSVRYFDSMHRPIPGLDNAFGKMSIHDGQGNRTDFTSLDPAGMPMADSWGNATLSSRNFDALGDAAEDRALDAAGKPTLLKEGWAIRRATYDANGNTLSEAFFGLDDKPVLPKAGYHGRDLTYDARGRAVREAFRDEKGAPTHDEYGCFGYATKFAEDGNWIESVCVDARQKPLMNDKGYATLRRALDAWGDVEKESYFDTEDKPVIITSGYQAVRYRRDDRGQEIERAYLLPNDQPAVVSEDGYSSAKREYADNGMLARERFYDPAGHPTTVRDGYSQIEWTYDEQGRTREVDYLGVDDRPIQHKDGNAGYRVEYDERGYEKERAYFGLDHALAAFRDGYAIARFRYDSIGNLVRVEYLDAHGQPTTDTTGIAGYEATFDARCNRTSMTYFDVKGHHVKNDDGYAGWKSEFDGAGHETRVAYIDENGRPTFNADGVPGWVAKFDAWGHKVEEHFVDAASKPVTVRSGYSISEDHFDQQGNKVEEVYRDVDGNLVLLGEDGCARYVYDFDDRRRNVKERCLDVHGNPKLNKQQWSSAIYEYDSSNNQVASSYFGREGQPALTDEGYHRVERAFDPFGNVADERYYDRDRHPTTSSEGFFEVKMEYSGAGGVMTRKELLDVGGKAASAKGGYHKQVQKVDAANRIVSISYYADGDVPFVLPADGYFRVEYSYDEKGRRIREAYFGAKGEPVVRSGGYHRVDTRYTEDGKETEKSFFNAKGQPTRNADGYARKTQTYLTRGGLDVTETAFFGVDGLPVIGRDENDRFAKRVQTYAGTWLQSDRFYGPSNEPLTQDKGCSGWNYEYDAWGNYAVVSCFVGVDASGADLRGTCREGFHRLERKYDSLRHIVRLATYDTNGKPTTNNLGYASVTRAYDERGNLTLVADFDAHGKPVVEKGGAASMTFTYDRFGNQIEEAHFGPDGQPFEISGIARIDYEYDAQGNQTVQRGFNRKGDAVGELRNTFDAHGRLLSMKRFKLGEPAIFAEGTRHHETRYEYDPWGRKVRETYYDKDGKPTIGKGTDDNRLCGEERFAYDVFDKYTVTCDPKVPPATATATAGQ